MIRWGLATRPGLVSVIHSRTLTRWLFALALIYTDLIMVPVPWNNYGRGLGASWILGLNLAHAHGLVAGRDIVFTYGPLGYLIYPDPISGSPVLALLYRLGLYFLTVAALARLACVLPSKVTVCWTALLLALTVVLDPMPESQGLTAVIAVAVLVLVDRSTW